MLGMLGAEGGVRSPALASLAKSSDDVDDLQNFYFLLDTHSFCPATQPAPVPCPPSPVLRIGTILRLSASSDEAYLSML